MVWWEPAAQQSLAVVTKPHQTRPLTLCPPLPHPQASPQFPVPETLRPVTTEPLTPHPVAAGSPPKGPESCALLMEDKSPSGPGCPFTVSVPVRPPPPRLAWPGHLPPVQRAVASMGLPPSTPSGCHLPALASCPVCEWSSQADVRSRPVSHARLCQFRHRWVRGLPPLTGRGGAWSAGASSQGGTWTWGSGMGNPAWPRGRRAEGEAWTLEAQAGQR